MKFKQQLLLAAALAVPAFPCAASWYWAEAQCSDEADENVYVILALVQTGVDGQEGHDNARFGFGNYAEENYAEEYCGVAEITAQNMDAAGVFDSREEADEYLTRYVEKKEADASPRVHYVRVDDYIDERE